MTESPSTPADHTPVFTVYCGGNKLNNTFSLVSASVHQALNSIGKATLKLDVLKPEGAPAFDENDAQLFKLGNAICLNVGEPGKEETLFDGIATGLSILKGNDQHSCITVECRDSDLPAKLNSNDRTSGDNWLSPVLAVTYGKDITAINLDFFASDIAVVSEEIMALKQCTNDVVAKAALAHYQGSCSFYGSVKVMPGSLIELKGLSKQYDGNLFVGSVTHTIDGNKWITQTHASLSSPFADGCCTAPFITPAKTRIEYDEERKIVTISTPEKNMVVLSDDGKYIRLSDQHRNEITMDKEGITLSSAKDIKLKAKGDITMDAGSKIDSKARMDIDLEGMNVRVKAKIGASVKGNATAELSASGQTTIKGAMVMIN